MLHASTLFDVGSKGEEKLKENLRTQDTPEA